MKITKLIVLSLVIAGFAVSAFAQMPQGNNEINLKEMRKKMTEMSDQEFAAMDTNKDGKISKEEYQKFIVDQALKKSEESFKSIDTNNDGYVTKKEYQTLLDEFANAMEEMTKNMQKMNDKMKAK